MGLIRSNLTQYVNSSFILDKFFLVKVTAIRFLAIAIIWSAIAGLHLFSSYLDAIKYAGSYSFNLNEVIYYVLAYQSWAIFSFFFFSVIEKYSGRLSPSILIFSWISIAILWLFLYLSIDTGLNVLLLNPRNQSWLVLLGNTSNAVIFFYFIFYCVTSAVCVAIFYYRSSQKALIDTLTLEKKQADSELKLTEIQLEQLQSRLSPHFLFNCLSSLSALARSEDKEALVPAIAQMGSLLRFCVSNSTERFILLEQELDFVDDYVSLQSLRYPELFKFEKEIATDNKAVLCPPFLLQPLVENTFTHGVDTAQELTQINLNIKLSDDRLIITITNTKALNTTHDSGLNSAIKNVKTRLQILYQGNFEMTLDNSERHFAVTLSIPSMTQDYIENE